MPLRNDPFQRLTLCGVFQRAMEVFMAEPITFVCFGAIGVLPNFFMNSLLITKFAYLFSSNDESDRDEVDKTFGETFLGLIGPILILAIWYVYVIVLKVSTVRATIQVFVQKKPILSQDLKHGFSLLPRMFCLNCALIAVGFVAQVIISVFIVVFIGPTTNFWITLICHISFEFAVMYYTFTIIFWDTALVVEDLSDFQPFSRSYDLVQGQCSFVFCAVSLAQMALFAVFGLHHFMFSNIGPYAVAIADALTGVVLSPYADIFLTVLYVNARVTRGEECNEAVLTQEMMVDSERKGSYYAVWAGIESDHAPHADEVEIMDTTNDSVQMV